MAEMLAMDRADFLVEPIDDRQALGRDVRADVTAIVVAAHARNQRHLLHAIEQPRDVRHAPNQPRADFIAAQPGVARYARGVTVFWTALLALQALVLAGLLAHRLLLVGPLPPWALIYQHVGGYLLIPLAFGMEYAFRRWHLRHIHHSGLRAQALQMMRRWPQLLHDTDRHP